MIYLDIETLDFFSDPAIKALPRDRQLAAMRFGCAVTCEVHTDHECAPRFDAWAENQIVDLYSNLVWCNQKIVGWNINDFDWPVIVHNVRAAGVDVLDPGDLSPSMIDLFHQIRSVTGRWYKLETVAQHNLGRGKLADGQRAAEWLRSGDPALIEKAFEYCRYDVQLTIDLHAIWLAGEPIKLPPRVEREEVNEVWIWADRSTRWVPTPDGVIKTK